MKPLNSSADTKNASQAAGTVGPPDAELIKSAGDKPKKPPTQYKLFNHVSTKDKIIFARQLSTLINAGLPLMQSLRAVDNQTSNTALKTVLGQIIDDVEGGSSFADSLAEHPKVFNLVFVSLVAAGEASGTLDKTLERLSDQQEKDAEIISKVRGALIYPAIVIVVM